MTIFATVIKDSIMRQICAFILSLCMSVFSASAVDIERLTNTEGLSNSSVITIFQDSSHLMWFGTWDGLNMYNGQKFKVFKPSQEYGNSICNNIIRGVVEDARCNVWIATDRGIDRYDVVNKSFSHYFTEMLNCVAVREHSFHVMSGPGGEYLQE